MRKLVRNPFLGLVLVVIFTSLACNALTPTQASSNPSEPRLEVNPPTTNVTNLPASTAVQGWVTFTAEDNLYTLDIPKDWVMDHWSKDGVDFFVDNFQSPDTAAYLEVFISDDGRPFPEADEKYIYALSVLERIYNKRVKVNVEKRIIEEDGAREIVIWTSNDRRFVSVYEVTNKTSFVMLTMYYYSSESETSEPSKQLIENFKVEVGSASELSKIEFSSVAEALTALKKKPGVTINEPQGWTIITETQPSIIIMWSFAPKTDPAYPAVAKRVFYEEEKSWYQKMDILCEAKKAACNKFVQDFLDLNEEMRKYIEKDQLRKYLEKMQGK